MPTPIVPIFYTPDYAREIARAADLLANGGLVVLPTETVYGAAGVLTRAETRSRLQELRSTSADAKPLTLHLARPDQAHRYIGNPGELGQRMIRKLWPGPVALVFDVPPDRRRQVASELGLQEADLYHDGTVTLRCPDHAVAADVIGRVEQPVVAIGAGLEASELADKVDLVLDAGPARYSKPSTIVRVRPDGYDIVRPGLFDERIIERLLRTTVLFVCSGNTCRSPMAEALARNLIATKLGIPEDELPERGIQVLSAGAMAMPGTRATPAAVEAVKDLGADLTKHRSRPLTVELIHAADIIFVMGNSHRAAVLGLLPSAADKVVGLDPEGDIEDPFGSDEALYRKLAGRLRELIEHRLKERSLA